MVTEELVIESSPQRDQTDLEALIHQYHTPVLGYLERQLNDREKAQDIVQETFLKLFRQLRDRPSPEHVSAWLYRVAANLCRDYWRSAGYRREKQVLDQLPELTDRQPQTEEICERRETHLEMAALLNELNESQREIVILRFYKQLKLQEIADVLECPIGTVKSRLFHALRFLKGRIEENGRVNYG